MSRLKWFLCIGLGLLLVSGVGVSANLDGWLNQKAWAAKDVSQPLEKAFPHSDKCKRCHLRVFEEWETSAQSRSIVTAPFRVSLERYLAQAKGKDQYMCFRCHAPAILEYSHEGDRFVKEVRSKDPRIDGVGCSQCHLIQSTDPKFHPPLPTYQLGRTVFGSYKKPADNLAHQSVPSPLYGSSQYCLTCHDAIPGKGKKAHAIGLMGDWKSTNAEKNGKNCQSCHMPEQFGESANGERPRKTANHSFPGRFGKVRAKAATVDMVTTVMGEQSKVQVTVKSLVPHNLPLPHPGWSRMTVDLTILGKNLKAVYSEQRHYERVFADAKGNPTVFDFEAESILRDTLMKPEETRVENFSFPTPKDAPSMDVIVTLTYGQIHGPKDFLKAVEQESSLGKKDRAFRPVQILREKVNIKLKKKK